MVKYGKILHFRGNNEKMKIKSYRTLRTDWKDEQTLSLIELLSLKMRDKYSVLLSFDVYSWSCVTVKLDSLTNCHDLNFRLRHGYYNWLIRLRGLGGVN